MTKYKLQIWLFLIMLFEVVAINYHKIFPEKDFDKTIDYTGNYGPGILFSLFIILPHYKKWSGLRMLGTLVVLFAYYLSAFLACFITWGFALPIAGALGALLVKKSLHLNDKLFNDKGRKYTFTGFIAGLIGLVLFYLADVIPLLPKSSIEIIIVLWQLSIGWLVIKDQEELNSQP